MLLLTLHRLCCGHRGCLCWVGYCSGRHITSRHDFAGAEHRLWHSRHFPALRPEGAEAKESIGVARFFSDIYISTLERNICCWVNPSPPRQPSRAGADQSGDIQKMPVVQASREQGGAKDLPQDHDPGTTPAEDQRLPGRSR